MSELIDPEVVCSADKRTIWVGFDQYLAAIDRLTGRIHISMKLQTNLFEIMEMENLRIRFMEGDVVVVNLHTGKITPKTGASAVA